MAVMPAIEHPGAVTYPEGLISPSNEAPTANDARRSAHGLRQVVTIGAAGLCSVDPKRVCRLNRGSSVRWNRGGHHRNDKQHQADGDEHDRIVQIADRPLGYNLVKPHAQGETSEESRDDGQDRRLYRSAYDAPATGTERHTDAKFFESARHRVRHDTVEPDYCEHQRKHREAEQQQRHEPLTGPARACQRAFGCVDAYGLIGIDGTHGFPN